MKHVIPCVSINGPVASPIKGNIVVTITRSNEISQGVSGLRGVLGTLHDNQVVTAIRRDAISPHAVENAIVSQATPGDVVSNPSS
jgi:hypothetical protein